MTSEKKGIPSLNTVLSKLTRRSETKSDSTPPSPVVGLRKAASGAIHIPVPVSVVLIHGSHWVISCMGMMCYWESCRHTYLDMHIDPARRD